MVALIVTFVTYWQVLKFSLWIDWWKKKRGLEGPRFYIKLAETCSK